MKKLNCLLIISIAFFVLAGCGGSKPEPPDVSQRPPWIMNEPEVEGSDLYFVGLSLVYASEQGARDNAIVNANKRIIQYLGSEVKSKFERAVVTYGLSSDAIDPVGATREFERLFAKNATHQVKPQKWYMEREQTATGSGYKYFVLAKVPKYTLDQAYQETLKQAKKQSEAKVRGDRKAATAGQAEKAAKMWADLEKQGLID